MRYSNIILCMLLIFSQPALGEDIRALLKKAVNEIGDNSQVPIRLPSIIPDIISKHGVKSVLGKSVSNGYSVSIYYAKEPSNAALAGIISGSTLTFESLPNTVSVKLLKGTNALFRPVQCGGSCAPANIWWQIEGVEYSIQLKLPSTLREEEQKKVIVEMANSMAMVQS